MRTGQASQPLAWRFAALFITHKEVATDTTTWNAGPILKALSVGGTTTTSLTLTNATGDDVSDTVTATANLVSGATDYFALNVWYDSSRAPGARPGVGSDSVTPKPAAAGSDKELRAAARGGGPAADWRGGPTGHWATGP
jgi:hypothetical protein